MSTLVCCWWTICFLWSSGTSVVHVSIFHWFRRKQVETKQQFLEVWARAALWSLCTVLCYSLMQLSFSLPPLGLLVRVNLIFTHWKLPRRESSGKITLINYCYSNASHYMLFCRRPNNMWREVPWPCSTLCTVGVCIIYTQYFYCEDCTHKNIILARRIV